MKRRLIFVTITVGALAGGLLMRAYGAAGPPPPSFNAVQAQVYDPGDTDTAQAVWVDGIGCPNATATKNTTNSNGSFTDPACSSTYDTKDEENSGLLLSKEGPTPTNSAGTANLGGIMSGLTLNELGYDIRTVNYPGSTSSHCGAGAPRFNVTTTTGTYFVGCSSPPATSASSDTPGSGGAWTRLRWGNGTAGSVMGYLNGSTLEAVSGTVKSIGIVFDEGTDTGPDYFGAAILDNIDFNGTLVGRG